MERPILFNTNNVKAILEGRKTQTRRLSGLEEINKNPNIWNFKGLGILEYKTKKQYQGRYGAYFHTEKIAPRTTHICPVVSPYEVGDILWVRETWNCIPLHAGLYDMPDKKSNEIVGYDYWYKADDTSQNPDDKWRPLIHMPRAAARLFLKVIDVRVERLQDITEEDALLEGLKNGWEPRMNGGYITAMSNFEDLWDSIYGKSDIKKWESNPWVFVTEFEVTKNEN